MKGNNCPQPRFVKMAKYVVNSYLTFARNFSLAERYRLRSSQPRKATGRSQSLKKN